MKTLGTFALVAMLMTGSLVTTPVSAQFAAAGGSALAASKASAVTEVQFHGRRGFHGRGFGHRGYVGRRGYYGRGYYGRGYGYRRGVGAGLAGLAAGAIIGGAIASQAANAGGNSVAYCESRFKSYDPGSGTYLGYDGLRHPCP